MSDSRGCDQSQVDHSYFYVSGDSKSRALGRAFASFGPRNRARSHIRFQNLFRARATTARDTASARRRILLSERAFGFSRLHLLFFSDYRCKSERVSPTPRLHDRILSLSRLCHRTLANVSRRALL